MFNALNTLVTGVALGGVVYTGIVQRSQITMQLHELEMAAEQLKIAREERKEAIEQSSEMRRQADDQRRLALNAAILNAKIALMVADGLLTGTQPSGGLREKWEQKTQARMELVEVAMQTFEAELLSIQSN